MDTTLICLNFSKIQAGGLRCLLKITSILELLHITKVTEGFGTLSSPKKLGWHVYDV